MKNGYCPLMPVKCNVRTSDIIPAIMNAKENCQGTVVNISSLRFTSLIDPLCPNQTNFSNCERKPKNIWMILNEILIHSHEMIRLPFIRAADQFFLFTRANGLEFRFMEILSAQLNLLLPARGLIYGFPEFPTYTVDTRMRAFNFRSPEFNWLENLGMNHLDSISLILWLTGIQGRFKDAWFDLIKFCAWTYSRVMAQSGAPRILTSHCIKVRYITLKDYDLP